MAMHPKEAAGGTPFRVYTISLESFNNLQSSKIWQNHVR